MTAKGQLLSPKAIMDLEDIFDYTTKKWSYIQAEKYQDEIYFRIMEVVKNPEMGKTYYFKSGNYKNVKANRHLIFYKIDNKDCIVVRILHERMDLNSHLF